MGSRTTRQRQIRRDRRKAKASDYAREPKGNKVGHGTSLKDADVVGSRTEGRSPDALVAEPIQEVGPAGPSPLAAQLEALMAVTRPTGRRQGKRDR